jgi:hypothetical protein
MRSGSGPGGIHLPGVYFYLPGYPGSSGGELAGLDRMLSEAEAESEATLTSTPELDGVEAKPSLAEASEAEIGDVEDLADRLQNGAEADNFDETPEASLPHLRFTAEIGRIVETDILMPDR